MLISQSLPRIYSPFLSCPLKLSSFSLPTHKSRPSFPRIKALDLDQNTIVAVSVGVASIAVGIGIPFFYESQIDSAAKRDNTQPCFPCDGSGAQNSKMMTEFLKTLQ
ncbi:hypothetical protein RHMOL_Rhmol06G0030300 [Rhododendron molle]|uniref:Uncharacterized protein n=1 Tax=Rhododendron molle TaxID=49168 RepID=A0ACC0N9V6_RHOML|nr:hypothetical protein RHMOL_Rhmol06G0030300 [Rhododendron molle]